MPRYFKVSIIGSGNLSWHLAQALESAGHFVVEIYSRKLKNARQLTSKLYDTAAHDSLDFRESPAEIFIIAVPDQAIEAVVKGIRLPENAILIHTSGTRPMDLLDSAARRYGVFYPLQTFSKGAEVSFKDIPICLESSSSKVMRSLKQLAETLSKEVHQLNSQERKQLHLAAVFACNFTNHLLTLSQEILEEQDVNFHLLQPLIAETINKGLSIGPDQAQTGPAIRGDEVVMKDHLKILKKRKDLQKIYRLLSQHIYERYH